MSEEQPRPIVANRTKKSERYATPPAWQAHEATQARRREQREQEMAEARPVKIVDLDLPLSAVFALYIQVALIQLLVAAVVVAALFFAGVL